MQKLLDNDEPWRDVLDSASSVNKNIPRNKSNMKKKTENKMEKDSKVTGVIMGKLHQDMMFLEKLAYHPELKKDLLEKKFKKKDQDITGTAMDGLSFLQVRKSFWETSEPTAASLRNRKCLRRNTVTKKNKECGL